MTETLRSSNQRNEFPCEPLPMTCISGLPSNPAGRLTTNVINAIRQKVPVVKPSLIDLVSEAVHCPRQSRMGSSKALCDFNHRRAAVSGRGQCDLSSNG